MCSIWHLQQKYTISFYCGFVFNSSTTNETSCNGICILIKKKKTGSLDLYFWRAIETLTYNFKSDIFRKLVGFISTSALLDIVWL